MAKTLRLLDDIQPIHYTLTLSPDIDSASFSGEETIQFYLKESSRVLIFHGIDVIIEKVTLEEGGKIWEGSVTYDKDQETIQVLFEQIFQRGEKTIFFSFQGILSDKLRGWYRSRVEKNGKSSYIAVTQFEETEARYVFPCIDEPSAKAVFDVTLIVEKDLTAISNTIPDTITQEGEKKRVHFIPTPKMSTYPLAFIVGKFDFLEKKTAHNVLVRVFVTPGKKKQGEFSLDVAIRALEMYEEYFGIVYPLPKLDLIAVPDFDAGAMENWGAIVFRETALLFDENNSSFGNKQMIALVIAHELAHMWFGNLVTMEWWTHLWLNEGFACYMEYFITDKLFPDWDIWTQFLVREHNNALRLDGLKHTHPIEIEIENIASLKEIFDEISYAKGACIIEMIATYIGEEAFRKGLHEYLIKHSYANAATHHLWEAFSDVSQRNIADMMCHWTQKSGHPILLIEKQDTKLRIIQERFFSSSVSRSEKHDDILWQIPFCVQSNQHSDVYLMKEKEMFIPVRGEWQKINSKETSFIRVLYDESLYKSLKEPIQKKILNVPDRLGIIRDIFDGAQAGYSSIIYALKILESYTKETEYTVWVTIIGGIERLSDVIGQDIKLEKMYDEYVCQILEEIAGIIGWEKKKNEKHNDVFLRSVILNAYGKHGDKKTIAKARALFRGYKTGKQVINPDIRGVVYNLVAESGGEHEFEQLKKSYEEEQLHQEKNRIGFAITSFKDPVIIKKIFEWVISDAVRTQDTTLLILGLFSNPKAQKITWELMKKNWDMLYIKYQGQHGLTRLIEGAGNLMTKTDASDIKQFFERHPAPDLDRTIQQVLEQIYSTAAWWEREKSAIENFFQSVTKE